MHGRFCSAYLSSGIGHELLPQPGGGVDIDVSPSIFSSGC